MIKGLPSSPGTKPVEFFTQAIINFRRTTSAFQVICTVPPSTQPPYQLIILDSSFNPPTRAHLSMARSAILQAGSTSTAEKKRTAGPRIARNVRLLLLLAVNNADKAPQPASFEQRLSLMWAFAHDVRNQLAETRAAAGDEYDEDNDDDDDGDGAAGVAIDLGLTAHPYFHDKSAAVAETSPYGQASSTTEQVILVGFDTLVRILDEKYYRPAPHPASPPAGATTALQQALGPMFARARLRVSVRPDDRWGDERAQREYVRGLTEGNCLQTLGASPEWGDRIELGEGRWGGEGVSSTLARDAARRSDWAMLDRVVTPEVAKWIRREGLYTA